MVLRLVVTVSASLVLAGAAHAGTFYVSPSGSDASDGKTPSTAWKTVGRVNQAELAPGDHVLFEGGARFDDTTLMPQRSGSRGRPVVFASYGQGRAFLVNKQAAVWLPAGASWLRFNGLRLSSGYSPSSAFASAGSGAGSAGITITNCLIGSTGGAAIDSPKHADSGWIVDHNTLSDTGDSGIIALGSGFQIEHNRILHTGWSKTISWGKHGIYAKGPDMLIAHNTIVDFSGDGISLRFDGDVAHDNTISVGAIGVGYFDYSPVSGQVVIDNNRISEVSDAGVYVDAGTEPAGDGSGATRQSFRIAGNTITTGGATAIDVRRTHGSVEIARNTIAGAKGLSLRLERPAGTLTETGDRWLGGSPQFTLDGRWFTTLAGWRAGTGLGAGDTFASG